MIYYRTIYDEHTWLEDLWDPQKEDSHSIQISTATNDKTCGILYITQMDKDPLRILFVGI